MKIWQRDCCTQQLGSPVFEFIHNPLNFNNAIMLLLIYTKTKSIIIHYNYTLHLLFNCTKLRWGLFSFFNETLDNKICMTILLGFIGSMAYSESGKICLLSLLNSHSLIMVYQGYAVCLMRLTSHIKYQCQTDKYLSFRNPMMNTYCATEAVLNSCHLFPGSGGSPVWQSYCCVQVFSEFIGSWIMFSGLGVISLFFD